VTTRGPVPAVVPETRRARIWWRRCRWRVHWAFHPQRPLTVNPWWGGMTLIMPRSGSAATAFYRTFPSEAIARWMAQLLEPGMTAIDVGAHVGVYSMLAARLVGEAGSVHAIEPQSGCSAFIEANASRNGLANVTTHVLALADFDGEVELQVDPRTLGGLAGSRGRVGMTATVEAQTLETFVSSRELARIDLLKLDAAGNEFAVLRGADACLGGAVRNIVCKLYHPDVVEDRFGTAGHPAAIVDLLRRHGYRVELSDGRAADDAALRVTFADGRYSTPLLASLTSRGAR
jgi:FkbM family methyltransferase